MAKKFTPIKKNSVVAEFKAALMNGYIIRYDGYHDCVEVLPRSLMGQMKNADNLFQHTGSLYSYYNSPSYKEKSIKISGKALWDAKKEIEDEYSMTKVHCGGSGCCQYATWAIYLND